MQSVEKYTRWVNDYQENQITIIYDTMWGGTKKLAEKIAEGIVHKDPDVEVKVFNLPKSDQNDMITEVFKSKIVIIGSPTMGNTILHSVAGFIHLMKQLKFKNKKAVSFGCYGWSGGSTKILNGMMKDAGFEVMDEGLKNQWNPNGQQQLDAIAYGEVMVNR